MRWRYRLLIVVALLILTIVYVPLIPYSPYCWSMRSVGPVVLAPAFRAKFTDWLGEFGVPYIRVGGVVFIRFWDWFTDPDDWVINASNKSVNALINPRFLGADLEFKQPPPHVRDLIAESEREHGQIWETCELVRAVAIEGW